MSLDRFTHYNIYATVRPTDFESFVGQEELMGPKGLLRKLICNDRIPSMILCQAHRPSPLPDPKPSQANPLTPSPTRGPPGSGKTTAARMIAQTTRSRFVEMGGVTHATADVKRAFEDAWSLLTLTGQRTILFLDEIHRFNKAQQDLFLPYVERGTIVLVGATTENPSFKVNAALLSRCRVFVLERIGEEEMVRILKRAVQVWRGEKGVEDESGGVEGERGAGKEGENGVQGTMTKNNKIDEETKALRQLALVSDGDARNALNILDLALTALSDPTQRLSHEDLRGAFQKSHLLYDRVGEEHYNAISALHKSIRGSDADAALYWLARMLEAGEDPLYVARRYVGIATLYRVCEFIQLVDTRCSEFIQPPRLIRCASEDIGLADNQALPLVDFFPIRADLFVIIYRCWNLISSDHHNSASPKRPCQHSRRASSSACQSVRSFSRSASSTWPRPGRVCGHIKRMDW
ncbi:Werner helicase interacting protein [Jimgerdemannia flammicorona]|uniref:Werner helicase interacting protein n=1 Tax=Jimgerdemannia flammicorona TaxID=994334 RepID=A0A433BUH9_9FUNG|nr:Werner helicase interacting protein [Jimgerdemannia flammicorona]